MSEEPATLDLVGRWRQAAEAAYRGELDATMRIFAPDAVWEVQPLGISHRGASAIRSFVEDWLSAYESYEDDQEEGFDLGNGVTFVVSRLDARPVGSPGRMRERWSFTALWAAGMVIESLAATTSRRPAQPPNASPKNGDVMAEESATPAASRSWEMPDVDVARAASLNEQELWRDMVRWSGGLVHEEGGLLFVAGPSRYLRIGFSDLGTNIVAYESPKSAEALKAVGSAE
jgi:ketosteroid isomerase-like protein